MLAYTQSILHDNFTQMEEDMRLKLHLHQPGNFHGGEKSSREASMSIHHRFNLIIDKRFNRTKRMIFEVLPRDGAETVY